MTSFIHKTALVDPAATIGDDCFIGPYCTVGPNAVLGREVRLESHVVVDGHTTIGDGTRVSSFVSIGQPPQDLKYVGQPTRCEIGKKNLIREFVTIHRGTEEGGGATIVGEKNLLMAYVHIAHDCRVGSNIIMANGATLGGHVHIGDNANIGGLSGIHQFCRVGIEAFVGGSSIATKDVLPYSLVQGNHTKCFGLNRLGLRRRGYSRETIDVLNHAFHLLLSSRLNTSQALDRIEGEISGSPEVDLLVEFIRASKRGVVK